MRRLLLAVAASTLVTFAGAADLSGIIVNHVMQKVPATLTLQIPAREGAQNAAVWILKGDAQAQLWQNPTGLQAENLTFYYFYSLGPDYWVVMLGGPQAPLRDYLGTSRYRAVGTLQLAEGPGTLLRIEGGRFSGYMAMQGPRQKLFLMPPALVARSPRLAPYLK
ncbi:hypothetical protein [Deinococcus aquiradiocola]|uniref:Uncharacterized protein n=1 Tax=Deinococcus aquiradiocola TaxID=393059 RepID=A0A917PEV0_9DEIO|nr:hypothetical protein [Deinococcus aquiradiocola]GGJ73686.1 hypothetical protein GCM10008939_17450 [Deinococcus aquiradiocola]